MARFGKIEIPDEKAAKLSSGALVDFLVIAGASRLTAERIVAIERGNKTPGRARPHATARR